MNDTLANFAPGIPGNGNAPGEHADVRTARVSGPGQPIVRRATHAGSFERWHLDDTTPPEEDGWLLVYLDVITLLLVMMVVMLAFSEPITDRFEAAGRGPEVIDTDAPPARPDTSDPSTVVPPIPLPMPAQPKPAEPSEVVAEAERDPLAGLPLSQLGKGIEVIVSPGTVSFRISSEILFASGDAGLTPAGQEVMDRLLPVFNGVPDHTIVVEGHTDNVPIQTARFPSNWELAAGRAGSVVRHLQLRGINPTRLRATGYAETRPLDSNDTPEGRSANRRVELTLEAPKGAR